MTEPTGKIVPVSEREQIVRYLRHAASVEVGSILSPAGRQVVEFCASWIENRLDQKWANENPILAGRMVFAFSGVKEP